MLAEQLVLVFDERIAALTEAREKNLIMRIARLQLHRGDLLSVRGHRSATFLCLLLSPGVILNLMPNIDISIYAIYCSRTNL